MYDVVIIGRDLDAFRRLADGTWVFFMDHPSGADPSWALEKPPHTE